MPVQTQKKANVYFPDGAKVSLKASGEGSFTDVGAINSAVTASLTWTENEVTTANAGVLQKQIRDMKMEGALTLINLEPASIVRLSGGALTNTVTAGTPFTDAPNQVVANGSWADLTPVNLAPTTAAGASVRATAISFTSVTGSVNGALTVNNDYTLVTDTNSASGFSIVFNLAGTTLATLAQDITIVYNSVTPVAQSVIKGGASTVILNAVAMRITHTDDNSKVRQLDLYAVDMNSGGFQFNFKGANEDGIEEMPLAYTAKLDTSRTSGDQLFAWTIEDGAQ